MDDIDISRLDDDEVVELERLLAKAEGRGVGPAAAGSGERSCANCGEGLDSANRSLTCQAPECGRHFCEHCERWWTAARLPGEEPLCASHVRAKRAGQSAHVAALAATSRSRQAIDERRWRRFRAATWLFAAGTALVFAFAVLALVLALEDGRSFVPFWLLLLLAGACFGAVVRAEQLKGRATRAIAAQIQYREKFT